MKKNILLPIAFALLAFFFAPSETVLATDMCLNNIATYNAACWTWATTGYWDTTSTVCTWTCGYPLSICTRISDDYQRFCHNTPSTCESIYPGFTCGLYSSLCRDDCGNVDCENSGRSTGDTHIETTSVWVTGTTYTCHYWKWDGGFGTCDAAAQKQPRTGYWTSVAGQSCSDQFGYRYCCGTPSATLSITENPVTAESPFDIDWTFNDTDYNNPNGYDCTIYNTGGYDLNLNPPSPLPDSFVPGAGNGGTVQGLINYPGPYPGYPHVYEISCTNPQIACPTYATQTSTTVTPLPLEAHIIFSQEPAAPTTTVQITADVRYGAPYMTTDGAPENDNYMISWSSSPSILTLGPGWYSPTLKSISRRIGVVGLYEFTLTARDKWNNSTTTSKTLEVVDYRDQQ